METGRRRARFNAMRTGLVVAGSLAFAYLSFKVGFKPYLERAQETMDRLYQEQAGSGGDLPSSSSEDSYIDTPQR